jgi:hypothetical protein
MGAGINRRIRILEMQSGWKADSFTEFPLCPSVKIAFSEFLEVRLIT